MHFSIFICAIKGFNKKLTFLAQVELTTVETLPLILNKELKTSPLTDEFYFTII